MRKDMEKSTKEATKDMKETDKIMKDSKSPVIKSNPANTPDLVK